MIVTKDKAQLINEITDIGLAIQNLKNDLQRELRFFDLRSSIPLGEIADWGSYEITIRIIADEVSILKFDDAMAKIKTLLSQYQQMRKTQFELKSQLEKIKKQSEVIENVRIV
jgi:hypothetical protein